MSCCCCCCNESCERWRQIFQCCDCPAIYRDARRKSSSKLPHIQYTPVSSSEEQNFPHDSKSSLGRHSAFKIGPLIPSTFQPPLQNGKMSRYQYAFMQGRPQMMFHPQFELPTAGHGGIESGATWTGVNVGEAITDQPLSGSGFSQRFNIIHPKTTHRTPEQLRDLQHMSCLPIYREKCLKTYAKNEATILDDSSKVDPVIQFSIHYDVQHSKLRVCLQHASNLPMKYQGSAADMPLRCNPFVMLHLDPDRRETPQSKKIKGTQDPVFDENFVFHGVSYEYLKIQTLILRLFNGAQGNKAIGQVSLPLSEVDLFGIVMQMKIVGTDEMENLNYQGDLHISISYDPRTCKLEGIIHRATGLRKHDMFGTADPYVKVHITYRNEKVFRWKTAVKKNTLSPVYNELFTYHVTDEMRMAIDVGNIELFFYLIDRDYLTPNDTMGVVNIGKNVQSKLGRKHWNEVLRSPCQRISFWHPIQLATPAQTRSRCNSPAPPR